MKETPQASKGSDDEWILAELVPDTNGEVVVEAIRPLGEDEGVAALASVERLNRFSRPALIGPLSGAWDDLQGFLHIEQNSELAQSVQTVEFRAEFSRKLSHWLTTFTAFRAQLQRTIEDSTGVRLSATQKSFDKAYLCHPEYRLVWQLRNLDQHDAPASSVFSFRSSLNTLDYVAMINISDIFARRIEPGGRDAKQWRECAALWEGREGAVVALEVFGIVMGTCQTLLATGVSEVEVLLIEDVARLAGLYLEALKVDGMPILLNVRDLGAGKSTMLQATLDPTTFVNTLTVLNAARIVLKEPELDFTADSRFIDAFTAIATMQSRGEN